jgi:hypothetical protein
LDQAGDYAAFNFQPLLLRHLLTAKYCLLRRRSPFLAAHRVRGQGVEFASAFGGAAAVPRWTALPGRDANDPEPTSAAEFAAAKGTRSLLVSHWAVSDEAAARLMIGTFRASARDPKLSHAEALRQSMLAMIDGAKSDAEADPRLWAPFVVVGEPAKAQ